MENIISIKGLEFSYGNSEPILSIDELNIKAEEKVFLYGPSGSGKTTLLGLIAGVIEARTGQIDVLGNDFTKLSKNDRDLVRGNDIGYIFQVFNLIPYLSAIENVLLSCQLNFRRKSRSQNMLNEATSLLKDLGLENKANQSVTSLSIGQQQRVAVARALLGHPPLIIADEPTSALDNDHQESFLKILFELCEKNKTTLVFVSHNHDLKKHFSRSVDLKVINKVKQHDTD